MADKRDALKIVVTATWRDSPQQVESGEAVKAEQHEAAANQ